MAVIYANYKARFQSTITTLWFMVLHERLFHQGSLAYNVHPIYTTIPSFKPKRRLPFRTSQLFHHNVDIPEIQSNSFPQDFASSGAWGDHPILLRSAFDKVAQMLQNQPEDSPWPSWEYLINLASDPDVECRYITHDSSNRRDSWKMQIGPMDDGTRMLNLPDTDSSTKWTIVINDVDRFHPELSEWIGRTFEMIPQWRRDDGQISLANTGGGIGAHVDDYDVFLIQMSGTRKWEVGKRKISSREELESLVPGIDVRILDFWNRDVEEGLVESFTLFPGDVLYLPPRFGHCGTALSDGCMTLSVGLRALSAKDMITKLSDDIVDAVEGKFLDRYTDPELLSKNNAIQPASNELDEVIKSKGKELIRNAINEMLDDDDKFDAFFGKLVTESKRLRLDYPISLSDMSHDDMQDLGVWGNADSALEAVQSMEGTLYAAEGTAWAYSIIHRHNDTPQNAKPRVCRLFIDGTMREVIVDDDDCTTIPIIKRMVDEKKIDGSFFQDKLSPRLLQLFKGLVQEGYLYGFHDHDENDNE